MVTTLIVVVALVTSVLVVVNLLTNLWARQHYLLISFWATGVLLAIAWLAGLSWQSLGLAPSWGAQTTGLIWSAALVGLVFVGYAVAAALPWTRKGFADARTANMGVGRFLYEAFLRIPFGTALMEEVAFRGVLLAAVSGAWGTVWGVAVSSVLFGFWHLLPALEFHESSSTTDRLGNNWRGKLLTVAGQVVGTGLAGVVFCLVRLGSDSLLPAIALHASLNALGFALSWAFARRLRSL
ncbi:MAG: CPBP family intramembrane metalloprotease [Actinobacteria bacterium]|nr:CPBP family intramembrane metalloprotease [Actinomycetota bacterium]MCB9413085.1 CPBP family intramembrane metalloprotease [Actinomycetota bacterium]